MIHLFGGSQPGARRIGFGLVLSHVDVDEDFLHGARILAEGDGSHRPAADPARLNITAIARFERQERIRLRSLRHPAD